LKEQLYCSMLDIAREAFVMPLRISGILSPSQMTVLFSNIEELQPIHRTLLQKLNDNKNVVGRTFSEMCPSLKAYASYCENYPRSLALLEMMNDNPEFVRIVSECESGLRAKGQSLANIIAYPVQQAQRYSSILAELISLTPKVHPDYALLVQASTKMKETLKPVVEQKRKDDMKKQIAAFADMIDGTLEEELVAPNRELVAELEIRVSEMHKDKEESECVLIVFNNLVLVCKEAPPQNAKPLLLQGYIPMIEARVILFAESPETPHCFEVMRNTTQGIKPTYRFFAKNEQQKDSMVKLLKGLVNTTRKDKFVQSSVSPQGSHETIQRVDDSFNLSSPTAKLNGLQDSGVNSLQPLCQSHDTTTPEMYVIFATESTIPIAMEFAPNTLSASNAMINQPLQLVSRQYWQPTIKQPKPAWLTSSSLLSTM